MQSSFLLSLRFFHQSALTQLVLLLLRNAASIQRRLIRRCAAVTRREAACVRLIRRTGLHLSHLGSDISLAREPARATAPNASLQRAEKPEDHAQQIKRNASLHRIQRLDPILLRQVSASQVNRPVYARQRSPENTYGKVPQDEWHALDCEEAVEAQGEDGQQADDKGVDFVGDRVGGLTSLVQLAAVYADCNDGAAELECSEGCAGVDAS